MQPPILAPGPRSKREPEQYSNPNAWTIDGSRPPESVWPIIRDRYIIPLQSFWYVHGIGYVPSNSSVFRPVAHELSKKRSGLSLHTFPVGWFGAGDITTFDGSPVASSIDLVIEDLPFRRICLYPNHNFLHVDYGGPGKQSGKRRSLWICSAPKAAWTRMSWLAEPR